MTDARFPERWLNDRRILRLPDKAFRLYVLTLAWSVANRTDGVIADDELALIPADASSVTDLEHAELWSRIMQTGWFILDFESTQATAADLAHLEYQRSLARDRKRRQRARQAAAVTRDVHQDSTRTGTPKTEGQGPGLAPSQSGKPPDHDGSVNGAGQAQHIPIEVHRQSRATGHNAREAAR